MIENVKASYGVSGGLRGTGLRRVWAVTKIRNRHGTICTSEHFSTISVSRERSVEQTLVKLGCDKEHHPTRRKHRDEFTDVNRFAVCLKANYEYLMLIA